MDREGGIDRGGRIIPPTRVRFFFFALIQSLSRARTTIAIRTAHFFPPVMIILQHNIQSTGQDTPNKKDFQTEIHIACIQIWSE
jgi:hypothetical protein